MASFELHITALIDESNYTHTLNNYKSVFVVYSKTNLLYLNITVQVLLIQTQDKSKDAIIRKSSIVLCPNIFATHLRHFQ